MRVKRETFRAEKKYINALQQSKILKLYDTYLVDFWISVSIPILYLVGIHIIDNAIFETVYFAVITALLIVHTLIIFIIKPYRDFLNKRQSSYDANEQYDNGNEPNPLNHERNRKSRKKKRKLKKRRRG